MTRTPELQANNLFAKNREQVVGNNQVTLKKLRRSFGPKGSIFDGSKDKLKDFGLFKP